MPLPPSASGDCTGEEKETERGGEEGATSDEADKDDEEADEEEAAAPEEGDSGSIAIYLCVVWSAAMARPPRPPRPPASPRL